MPRETFPPLPMRRNHVQTLSNESKGAHERGEKARRGKTWLTVAHDICHNVRPIRRRTLAADLSGSFPGPPGRTAHAWVLFLNPMLRDVPAFHAVRASRNPVGWLRSPREPARRSAENPFVVRCAAFPNGAFPPRYCNCRTCGGWAKSWTRRQSLAKKSIQLRTEKLCCLGGPGKRPHGPTRCHTMPTRLDREAMR